jgi:polyisoprenoid-binding protein YceI
MARFLWIVTVSAAFLSAQDKPIDVQRSTISIHVGKTGLFSVAGHEHRISAPISAGTLNDSDRPRVEFTVQAASMQVKDADVDAKTRAEIQRDMREKTLESAKYPEIAFRSSHIEKQAAGRWKVNGALTLHGVAKPVSVIVKKVGDAYTGRARLKQTDFGIKPISAAGGTVKVKNEVEIDFHIVPRS